MKLHLLFVITFISSNFGLAQHSVLNPKFEMMLDALLTHDVNEVYPNQVLLDKDIIFLDAREKREFDVSHIKNARWVGFNSFNIKRVDTIPYNKKIVVYCSVGYRSEKIVKKLIDLGYKNVSNLYGGIFEWVNQNHKVFNHKGVTKQIHAFNKVWAQWLDRGIKIYY